MFGGSKLRCMLSRGFCVDSIGGGDFVEVHVMELCVGVWVPMRCLGGFGSGVQAW